MNVLGRRLSPLEVAYRITRLTANADIIDKRRFERRDMGNFGNRWYSLVKEYTSCKLTYPSDKLPALSGIIRKLVEQNDDVYLAGLWRTNLIHWMSWQVAHDSAPITLLNRSPSWFWAKQSGEVSS